MAGLFGHRWKARFCLGLPVLRTFTLERLPIQSRISFKNTGPRALFGWRFENGIVFRVPTILASQNFPLFGSDPDTWVTECTTSYIGNRFGMQQ
jgi:hypothetical protein